MPEPEKAEYRMTKAWVCGLGHVHVSLGDGTVELILSPEQAAEFSLALRELTLRAYAITNTENMTCQ